METLLAVFAVAGAAVYDALLPVVLDRRNAR